MSTALLTAKLDALSNGMKGQMGPAIIREAIDEIERLRSDLALLVPVSLPASQMEQCGYCYTLCAETWKHCPNCGAQARIADRSVRHSKPSK